MFMKKHQKHQIKCVDRNAPYDNRRVPVLSVPFALHWWEVVQYLKMLHAKDAICSDKVSMF